MKKEASNVVREAALDERAERRENRTAKVGSVGGERRVGGPRVILQGESDDVEFVSKF